MSNLRFSIVLPIFGGANVLDFGLSVKHLGSTVDLAEKLGFDSLWVPDHLTIGHHVEILEAWAMLAAASQRCEQYCT